MPLQPFGEAKEEGKRDPLKPGSGWRRKNLECLAGRRDGLVIFDCLVEKVMASKIMVDTE